MQEKGPAATNWLKMRVIPQRGVGGLIRPERQMLISNPEDWSEKLLIFGQMLIQNNISEFSDAQRLMTFKL